jgi:tRNA U34 5-methylaminomethyl-2-thiouridine-forming methyltransferase MnmC
MTIPARRTFDSVDPRWRIQITDDGSPTLIDCVSGDSMHSGCGAIAETEHVYLHNSGVTARLQQGFATRILELGLGTGLGCLLSAGLANQCRTRVDYVAIENQLVSANVVKQLAFEQHGIEGELVNAFCELLRDANGRSSLRGLIGECCELTVYQCDATTWRGDEAGQFDAVFFDPFSPQTSPQLWSNEVLAAMHKQLKPGGKLVSYCVNRKVRDLLMAVGFEVARVPGPMDGKREVLVAAK